MKTSFDIPEPLLREVQRIAKNRNTTTKSLVEQALRTLLEQDAESSGYALPDRAVMGKGLQPGFEDASWELIRDTAYGSRL